MILTEELNIDKSSTLHINSLGNITERKKYIDELIKYLNDFKNKLSIDSKKRFEKNPLRILDSKSEEDIEIIKNAPKLIHYLDKESKNSFKSTSNFF